MLDPSRGLQFIALVRYSGYRRGIPPEAIEFTADAIPEWTDDRLALADDDHADAPAKQLMTAVQDAGRRPN